jgi:general secretion pathway protein F
MATFLYKAYTSQGMITAGTISADGVDAAIDALYGSGLTPFETYPTSGASAARLSQSRPSAKARAPIWKRELLASGRFKLKELTAFTVELASLTKSGLPLDTAFRIMAGPGASAKSVRLSKGLLKDVLAGSQLSQAMARRPEIFPPDYRALLSAGEAGGFAGQALRQIAELLSRRLEIRNKISAALIYPMILILMSLVSVIVIILVLVPSISPIFTDAGFPLPGILNTFAKLQQDLPMKLMVAGLLGITGVWLASKAKRNPDIMFTLDRLIFSLPVIGRLIQIREAAGFSRALGTLLGARVPLLFALQTARALVTNKHLNVLYQHAIERVPEGISLHQALSGIGLLPATSQRLVAIGEESGQLSPMLIQVATALESDLQRHIERGVGLLTPVLTLVIGSSVGALIMQVMSAILSINDLAFQ